MQRLITIEVIEYKGTIEWDSVESILVDRPLGTIYQELVELIECPTGHSMEPIVDSDGTTIGMYLVDADNQIQRKYTWVSSGVCRDSKYFKVKTF